MLEEIAAEVCQDPEPGLDGFSNIERVQVVRKVFGFTSFSITAKFDFELALANNDPMILAATYHLANLQRDFFVTALEYGAKVDRNIRQRIVEIETICLRIVYALSHDEEGGVSIRYAYDPENRT